MGRLIIANNIWILISGTTDIFNLLCSWEIGPFIYVISKKNTHLMTIYPRLHLHLMILNGAMCSDLVPIKIVNSGGWIVVNAIINLPIPVLVYLWVGTGRKLVKLEYALFEISFYSRKFAFLSYFLSMFHDENNMMHFINWRSTVNLVHSRFHKIVSHRCGSL